MLILSKIIGFLLDPVMWIVALMAIAFFLRRKQLQKKLYAAAAVIFLVFSNPFLLNNLWFLYQAAPVDLSEGETYEAAILLGGMAGLDEDRNKGIFKQAADRFIQAARLYETGRVKKILITGGDSRIFRKHEYKEAAFLAANLIDLHIPSKDILTETESRNTIENARLSKRILDSAGAKGPFLLVTSALHMPRALKAFHQAGINVKPYPCHFEVTGSNTHFAAENFTPRGNCLSSWKILLKEWLGTLQLTFTGVRRGM
jgi:uncharacterized SAM-binding protein YcdF (DUF218 family)